MVVKPQADYPGERELSSLKKKEILAKYGGVTVGSVTPLTRLPSWTGGYVTIW